MMPCTQLTKASSRLRSAVNAQVLESIGRRGTGFLQRLRIITPSNLVPGLIWAMGSGKVESLVDLHRGFNDDASSDVAEKSFYDRLDDPGFAPMMKGVFLHLSGVFVNQALRFFPGSPFRRFHHIFIQNGTCFVLRDSLAEVFPARARATAPAGVEIHTTVDLLTESPIAVAISPDTAAERRYLAEPVGLTGLGSSPIVDTLRGPTSLHSERPAVSSSEFFSGLLKDLGGIEFCSRKLEEITEAKGRRGWEQSQLAVCSEEHDPYRLKAV